MPEINDDGCGAWFAAPVHTINDVDAAAFEYHARRLAELMCSANLVRNAAGWAFNGWTLDGRAVRHRIKVEGYERTGPTVDRERAARATNE